jgi:ferric enterobactin receptor
MKKLVLLLVVFLICNIVSIEAQSGGEGKGVVTKVTITGQVRDSENNSPLEFATITFFSKKDSTITGGNVTDLDGKFSIETTFGSYAKIEFIAFEPKIIYDIPFEKGVSTIDIGIIKLESDAAVLAEVEVVAEKSQMQLSLDKRVFNVGKDLASKGGTAEDILDNVPSVTVDIEGNVSLRGSGGVRILIDGKPSGLVGADNANGLRSIPANMIDKVEVITNPSARYEAEGMAGIINIVLKKNQNKGLNGAFDLTVGYPETYGAAINLNFRKKNLNFFVNYGLRYRTGPGGGFVYQENYDGDTTYISDQKRTRNRSGLSNNIRFGADYFFSPKSTLTTGMTYKIGKDDNRSEVKYYDYINNLDNLTSFTLRTDDEVEDESNLEYFMTHTQKFKKKDQELITDIRYSDKSEVESSDFVESYFDGELNPSGVPNILQRSRNDEGNRNLQIQIDYIHPVNKDGKLEFGYRSSFRKITNDFLVEEQSDDLNWTPLEGLNNNFIYDENIHSLYAIYGNKIKKFSYQVGIRGEATDLYTELEQTNQVNDTLYAGLFPSVFLGYEAGDQNSFQISYSKRLRRPRFWDLNPFFTFSDARNFFSGNPSIGPENTDSYEISHIKYWDKASLTSAIYYRHSTDVIERITEFKPDGTTLTTPQNLNTRDDFGFEFTYNVEPFKWWRINGNFNFFRSITDGGNLGTSFQADTYSWMTRVTSQTTIFKNIDIQIRGNYRAPIENTQGRNKAVYTFDLGASKDILNKKATITINVRDVFNSRKRVFTTVGDNFYRDGEFQWRARVTTLAFNYRLNQKKNRGGRGEGGDFDGGGDF